MRGSDLRGSEGCCILHRLHLLHLKLCSQLGLLLPQQLLLCHPDTARCRRCRRRVCTSLRLCVSRGSLLVHLHHARDGAGGRRRRRWRSFALLPQQLLS